MVGCGISQVFFSIANSDVLKGWGMDTGISGIFRFGHWYLPAGFPLITLGHAAVHSRFWLVFGAFYLMGASFDLKSFGLSDWGCCYLGGILVMLLGFMVLITRNGRYQHRGFFRGTAFLAAGIFNIVLPLS